jgi:hypothetical protein
MNGRCTYTSPTTTANEVYSSVTGASPNSPMTRFSAATNTELGPRMIIQAYTRIRKLLQNGRITSRTSRSRCFFGLRAISIARGYAMSRHRNVVRAA